MKKRDGCGRPARFASFMDWSLDLRLQRFLSPLAHQLPDLLDRVPDLGRNAVREGGIG
jgi:hypothetical protein